MLIQHVYLHRSGSRDMMAMTLAFKALICLQTKTGHLFVADLPLSDINSKFDMIIAVYVSGDRLLTWRKILSVLMPYPR